MPLYMIACEVANEKYEFSEMSAPKHVIARSKATWQSPEDRFFLWIAFIKKWLARDSFAFAEFYGYVFTILRIALPYPWTLPRAVMK